MTVRVQRPGGASAEGVEVLLESSPVNAPPSFDFTDRRGITLRMPCDADGLAIFEEVSFGNYRVSARDGDGAADAQEFVFTGETERSLDLVKTGPDDGLVVRVQDAQGAAVPFAEVRVAGGITRTKVVGMRGEPSLESRCDGEGRVTFPGVDLREAVVHAESSDGRRGWAIVRGAASRRSEEPDYREVTVTLETPGVLEGRLLGRPEGWPGTGRVKAWALTRSHPHHSSFGLSFEGRAEGDRYSIEGLGPGQYSLTFEDTHGLRVDYPNMGTPPHSMPNSLAPIDVTIEAGRTTVQNLTVVRGATLAGVVRTAAGAPIAGALVKTTYTPMTGNFPDGFVLHGVNVWRLDSDSRSLAKHPLTHRETRTDEEGQYRIEGLPDGKLRVEVIVAGMSYDRREAVELSTAEVQELEHVLVRAGAIEGLEPGGGYLGVRRKGQSVPEHLAILPQAGDFYFPGLAPGDHEVLRYHSVRSIPPVLLAEVEVRAGETAWVDLRTATRPIRYELRLTHPYGPMVGANVRLGDSGWRKTDALGRVAFERAFPLRLPTWANVMRGPVNYQVRLADLTEDRGVSKGELFFGDETLGVRTLDARGAASAASLVISSNTLEGESVTSARTKALDVGPEGTLDLEHLVPGSYDVIATFPSGAEVAGVAKVPSAGRLELREYPAGQLSLLVTDASARPLKEAQVHVAWWSGEGAAPLDLSTVSAGKSSRRAETDAEGRATLRGLPAGRLSIRVGAKRLSWARQGPTVERSVELNVDEEMHLAVTIEEE
ncbi:Cna protein B-type domain protein [Planctomycetes bacterium Poly30]|uniref:Cna protein B-type domain protein n=1 Tax=Saltatorellus ferox TaxID=2528018 RepID=A0A518EX21_9BACT|nr:Cna protein B-type domain protein [Planctomycetes bacterium Poly30]